ncbi:MAG: cellulose biosynthesis cyclic di-GMP-binding regulatory protein BcsB [Chloroflexi bacterium]|nr:cellulose biosynthesis cyclic di-GMP-binding regulatory protein BcsB [Chloroflexota bacterium]
MKHLTRIQILIAVSLALLPLLLAVLPADARPPGEDDPLDVIPLAGLGYRDTTLRGRVVSTEYYLPGPGDFLLADDNWLDLDFLPSDLLAADSLMNILWNGIPMKSMSIGGAPGRSRVSVQLPKDRTDPDVNRVQIQAFLRMNTEVCTDDENGLHLTIFNTTQVRHSFADRRPYPRPAVPDLARYPAPFFSPSVPRPPRVLFVIPNEPNSAELTALVRVASQLGQFAGTRALRLYLARERQIDPADLAQSHLVLIGRQGSLSMLRDLPDAPVRRADDGGFLDPDGEPVSADTGVIFEMPSPWNSARLALVVTGADDLALERAALTLSGRAGIGGLRGDFALVTEATPIAAAPLGAVFTRLADLGRADDTVSGVGDHAISFSIDTPGLARDTTLPFDLVISHSPLMDRARSSFRLVVNGVPVTAVGFHDLSPARAVKRVELPPGTLRPGPNTLNFLFTFRLPGIRDGQDCARVPVEQAWAVLHADSGFQPPARGATSADEVSLTNHPYPFVVDGHLNDTLLVVPDALGDEAAFVQLAADLGRLTRADVLAPRAVRLAEFDAQAAAASREVILWGLPADNPLLGQLGGRLPIEVDAQQRLLLSRDMTLAVRDETRLGIVQLIRSPWTPGRSVLAVTGTGPEGLGLAVEALRLGNLAGNAALISRAVLQPSPPGRPAAPQPLISAGPRPEALAISTYRLRPGVEAPETAFRRPHILMAAIGVGALATILTGGLAHRAFSAGQNRGRRR